MFFILVGETYMCFVISLGLACVRNLQGLATDLEISNVNRKKYLFIVCFISILSTACREPFPGHKDLVVLCNLDAGSRLADPISVEGFYFGTPNCYSCASRRIVESGYDFIELKIEKPLVNYPFYEPGIWHVRKEYAGSDSCNERLQNGLDKKAGSGNYESFIEQFCLSAERIESPRSDFGFFEHVETVKVIDNKYGSLIKRYETWVENLSSGERQAFKITYRIWPYRNDKLHYGFIRDCKHLSRSDFDSEKKYAQGGVLSSSLKPKDR